MRNYSGPFEVKKATTTINMSEVQSNVLKKNVDTCDAVLKRLNSEKGDWKLLGMCMPEKNENGDDVRNMIIAKQATDSLSNKWDQISTCLSQLHSDMKSNAGAEVIREKRMRLFEALEGAEHLLKIWLDKLSEACENIKEASGTLNELKKSIEGTRKEINGILESLEKLENVPVVMPIRIKREIKQEVEEDILVVFENTPMSRAAGNAERNIEDKTHTTQLTYKDFVGQPSQIGSRQWISRFKDGEPVHMNKKTFCQIVEDGTDLFFVPQVPTLVKSTAGLGMKVPRNLGFPNLQEYLQSEERDEVTVIDSFKQKSLSKPMKISEVLNRFNTPSHERDLCINVLSNEESGSGTKFDREFRPPRLVKESLEKQLERVLIRKKDRIEEELEDGLITEERKEELIEQKKRIEQQMNAFPKYLKFVIVSMGGSFTNVHVDFSATSVFYHVFRGTKIFYLAQPTEENMAIYKQYETSGNAKKKWIVESLENEWERLVIEAGMTAIIPSGYIHAVYTPEDSIVVGGNFLMENQIARQFELSRLEEKMLDKGMLDYGSLYKEFNNVMFSYTENILFEKLASFHEIPVEDVEELKEQTSAMMNNLSKSDLATWYSEEDQERIIQKLKDLIPVDWFPVEEIPEVEAPAPIPLAAEEAENGDGEPEAVPEPDVTRARLHRACKRAGENF
ncbi:hypothetical protein B9Z55_023648 [Caenorhabditis nigoni]|uniref:JmjC domain-containing protein n=1 Tax=Caenorhabditis nigoni TaxID=1611254 RepID=A0A2G5SQN6_9PELO|nr:hypothetical protein B9Z55_023648 [Caenorhabditis nigoni]